MKTPFEILNIPERCTDEEVKAAYLERIRQYPPERFPEQFKKINAAFEQVKTERNRIAARIFQFAPFQLNDLWDAIKTEEKRIPTEKLIRIISEISDHHLKEWLLQKLNEEPF